MATLVLKTSMVPAKCGSSEQSPRSDLKSLCSWIPCPDWWTIISSRMSNWFDRIWYLLWKGLACMYGKMHSWIETRNIINLHSLYDRILSAFWMCLFHSKCYIHFIIPDLIHSLAFCQFETAVLHTNTEESFSRWVCGKHKMSSNMRFCEWFLSDLWLNRFHTIHVDTVCKCSFTVCSPDT